MEGDIYQIARDCRTNFETIEKYYAAHIKTSLNDAAINVTPSPILCLFFKSINPKNPAPNIRRGDGLGAASIRCRAVGPAESCPK